MEVKVGAVSAKGAWNVQSACVHEGTRCPARVQDTQSAHIQATKDNAHFFCSSGLIAASSASSSCADLPAGLSCSCR